MRTRATEASTGRGPDTVSHDRDAGMDDIPPPRRVRIILVDPAMSVPFTYESLLDAARRAALTGGLKEIRRMHFLLGPDADLKGQQFVTTLRDRFRGPLLERCAVTWEDAPDGGVVLASIEGYVTE